MRQEIVLSGSASELNSIALAESRGARQEVGLHFVYHIEIAQADNNVVFNRIESSLRLT